MKEKDPPRNEPEDDVVALGMPEDREHDDE